MESTTSGSKRCISCRGPASRRSSYIRNPQQKRSARGNLLVLLAVLILGPVTSKTSEALASSSTSNFSPRFNTEQRSQRNGIETTINGLGDSYERNGVNGKHNGVNGKHINGDYGKRNGVKENGALDGLAKAAEEDPIVEAEYIADTRLPTDIGHFKMRAYRIQHKNGVRTNDLVGDEPVVIYSPQKPPFGEDGKLAKDVPIRVHDQCLTSEVFGSKRCDCSEQLVLALEYVNENGGAVIYMQQEGRGIGLANKLAAYQLQDMGLDTVDANLHLGFPEDARQYGSIPSILEDMNIESIQLMTNNPRKVERLTELGVHVSGTVACVVPEANDYNRKYLETKQERMRHSNLANLLSSPAFVPKDNRQKRNGHMRPRKVIVRKNPKDLMKPVGGDLPPRGESNGVEVSFVVEGNEDETAHDNVNDVDGTEGVVAQADGYCFGKKSVEAAIAAVARGEMVVVVDDMDRENEGDLIMAADKCTDMDMAKIVRYSSGVICVGMEGDRMDELKLPSMVANNEDPKETAFSITVDATKEHGITTGISAADRAKTVRLLSDPKSKAIDFNRPGHLFPLRAKEGGVLTRDGHTEAAVDLSRLAGLNPCGILCEIVSEENPTEMMRLPELKRFAKQHGFVLTSIADLAQYRRDMNSQDVKYDMES